MTYILGINAFHGDSSACLIHNGQIIAAAEEERFRRIKHWAGFPSEAIRYCLQEESLS
jgi:carbamoyltransferase